MAKRKTDTTQKTTRVLVYGGSGLVGSQIVKLLSRKFKIITPLHSEVDVTDRKQVQKSIELIFPDIIIYAAGMASLDDCQLRKKESFLLNATVPSFIAKKASLVNIPIFYLSTNDVFDGRNSDRPYEEEDKPNPISVYGASKLLGEKNILATSNQNCIVRITVIYSPFFPKKKDFVRVILETLKKRHRIAGIVDQVLNPIFVDDVVFGLEKLIENNSSGIYHLGSTDYITNFNLAKKIAINFGLDESLVYRVTLEEFNKDKPALRTKNAWLNVSKFTKEFGSKILHSNEESIQLFNKQIKKSF